jgi:hypothetical protein
MRALRASAFDRRCFVTVEERGVVISGCPVSEITRPTGDSDWIDPDFVERERTPGPLTKHGVQMHLAKSSLWNTVSIFDTSGVQRSRKPFATGSTRLIDSQTAD